MVELARIDLAPLVASAVSEQIDIIKLDGIETGATADQTGAEIKALYEAESNRNAYTDTEVAKVANVPADTNQALADIVTLLASDDTTLDELQEVVNFIKLNRADLDALTLDNIVEGVTNKYYTVTEKTKVSQLSITQPVDLDQMEMDVTANNAKVTNVTTDLSYDASTMVVSSSDGTDATLTVVDGVNNGLMTVADKTKLDDTEITSQLDVRDTNNRNVDKV